MQLFVACIFVYLTDDVSVPDVDDDEIGKLLGDGAYWLLSY